jgi:hypothetical protein
MIFVATSAAWLTMNHRDESNYKGAAPAHPEEAAALGLDVFDQRVQLVRAREREYQKQVSADPNWPCSGFVEVNLLQAASAKTMEFEP